MSDINTIRIWLYPFTSTGKVSYKISDWEGSKYKIIITRKHIDILIDDNKVLQDEELKNHLSSTVIEKKQKVLVFMHSSTKKESNEKYFQDILQNEYQNSLTYFGNGNELNNRNYAALYEVIRSHQIDGKYVNGNKPFEADRILGNDNYIKYIHSENSNLRELADSEPEYSDNWETFLSNITSFSQLNNEGVKVWAFVQNISTYQLISLNTHSHFFQYTETIRYLVSDEKRQAEAKLNVILAPGNFNFKDYTDNLLLEIIHEKLIRIDNELTSTSRSVLKNIPLLILCGTESKKDRFFNSSIWSRIVSIDDDSYNCICKFEDSFKYLTENSIIGKQSLYELAVSKEFVEYVFRLHKNAYLSGPHNTISPVVFSDENIAKTAFEKNIENKIFEKLLAITTESFPKLKVLFIDDFATSFLKKWTKDDSTLNKKSILTNLLEEYVGLKIDLACIEEPKKFDNTILEFKPDIILLDYSFGQDQKTGSDYLEGLVVSEELFKSSPFRKLRIFPTTSFYNAFIDDIRSKGIEFSGANYSLSRGADLVNTPFLFLQYFTKAVLTLIEETQNVVTSIEALNKIWKDLHIFSWENICSNTKEYQDIYKTFEDSKTKIDDFLEAEDRGGILLAFLNSITIESDLSERLHDKDKKERVLRHYELLLYNLAYRNYKGNEEIILFNSLMRS